MKMSWLGKSVVLTAMIAGSMLGAIEASAATLTIKSSDKEVRYDKRIAIKGKLKPDAGVAAGGHRVQLSATAFGEKTEVIDTTTTSKSGSYAFKRLRARANTKFQVAISDDTVAAESRRIDVYAIPLFSVGGNLRGNVFRPTMQIFYSPDLERVPNARAVFYFRKTTSNVYVRKDVVKAKETGRGRQFASGKFTVPNGDYRFLVTGCIQFPDKKFGLFPPSNFGFTCPKTLPARGRQVVAFSSLSASPFIP